MNYGLTNIFSIPNSKGSYCLDLTSNYDTVLWGTSVNGHIGYQYIAEWPATVRNLIIVGLGTLSYTDWKLGLTKDFGGRPSLSISYVSTNANPYWWNTWSNPNGDVASNSGFASSAGRGGAVVAFIKTF